MRNVTKLLVLAVFGVFSLAICLPAGAQIGNIFSGVPPIDAWGVPVAYGNFGNGIVTTNTWTSGVGSTATTDSFGSGMSSGFGCGFGPFGVGPFQTGFGGNFGVQGSQAVGFSSSTTFGLQPAQVVFGIPVAGAGGLLYT